MARPFGAASLVILLTTAVRAQEPELVVEVDRPSIYRGESITYDVTVNHVEEPTAPSLDAFVDFQVDSLGQQSLNSQQITIINGRRTEIIRRGMLYRYRLTPKKVGPQMIPAPTADVNGTLLKGREVAINVIAPMEQDVVVLELAADKPSVYPMQPFTVTLTIAVRELPGELADQSPLSVQSRNPASLTVSWLDDDQIPDGLKPQKSWRQILEPIISRSRRSADGMQINDIGTQSVFSMFGRSNATLFLPEFSRTMRPDLSGEPVGYYEYELKRTFLPERVGQVTFSAASMKGSFGTALTKQGLQGEEIYAVSQPLTVDVRDVPGEGRPESYVGGIGTFNVTADVAPRTASVGDPLTLTVTIRGEGTIADLRAPEIERIPQVAEQFKLYEATEKSLANGRMFTWSLRPLTEEIAEWPSIPVAWFDVEQEQYVVGQTDPIPLTIDAARQLAAGDIVAAVTGEENGSSLEVNDAGLFANHSRLQDLRASRFTASRWMTIWAAMLAGYAAVSVVIQRRNKLRSDPALQRRRNARSRAAESLRNAIGNSQDLPSATPENLCRIVAGLIADFTGCPEAGMTSQDASQILASTGVSDDLRNRVSEFMDLCDAARYGAGTDRLAELPSTCAALVEELGRELDRRC